MIQAKQACERQPLNYIAVFTVLFKQHLTHSCIDLLMSCMLDQPVLCSMLTLHMYKYALISMHVYIYYIDAIDTILHGLQGP